MFDLYNRYPGNALLNHNLRISYFALEIACKRGIEVDEDLLRAGCHLHDIGLLIPEREEPSYLRRSWNFFSPYGKTWGLNNEQMKSMREMLLYNHSLRPLPCTSSPGELVRLAVEVEHSQGLLRHGLSPSYCRNVFKQIPRLNLNRILLDFARITIIEDGPCQLFRIFLPRFDV